MPRARPRDPGGRPSKYTATAACSIIADVGAGLTREEAARRANVGITTLERWIAAGRRGDPAYGAFATALHQAGETVVLRNLWSKAMVKRLG
jgi:hypothetical protein